MTSGLLLVQGSCFGMTGLVALALGTLLCLQCSSVPAGDFGLPPARRPLPPGSCGVALLLRCPLVDFGLRKWMGRSTSEAAELGSAT